MFKPLVDVRARIYDMQHEAQHRPAMTYSEKGEDFAVGLKLPYTQEDWHAKRRATDAVLDEIGGVATPVRDETHRELWSLYDGHDLLNQRAARFSFNIKNHIDQADALDPLHL